VPGRLVVVLTMGTGDSSLLLDLHKDGQLDLDGMVTRTYPLEGINEGYQDMHDGRNIQGVLVL
jgi:Zn-dependent alcohol dehydrogenase